MKVHILFPSVKKEWAQQVEKSKSPDHPLYGLPYFSKVGIETTWTDRGFGSAFWRLPFRAVDQWFLKKSYTGFKLDSVLSQLSEIGRAQVVLTLSESVGLPTLLVKKLGFITAPIVFASIGLDQRFVRKGSLLRYLVGSLLMEATRIVVYCESEKKVYHTLFGIPLKKLRVVPIGVDTKFLAPRKAKQTIDVLAAGRDVGRDFITLIEAVRATSIRTMLVCPEEHLFGVSLPGNVEHCDNVDYRAMRALFSRAKVIAVTVHPYKTSGQFGILEAWAMAKAVVASDVPNLTTAFQARHKKHYWLVPPNNAKALRDVLKELLADTKIRDLLGTSAHALVGKNYRSTHFAARLIDVIREVAHEQ